ncbi:MAG: hypothetical protein MZU91_12215 [Desulfosudis oleivorans]|nr:hypothetical protein [Desulfosudis oleivorans]
MQRAAHVKSGSTSAAQPKLGRAPDDSFPPGQAGLGQGVCREAAHRTRRDRRGHGHTPQHAVAHHECARQQRHGREHGPLVPLFRLCAGRTGRVRAESKRHARTSACAQGRAHRSGRRRPLQQRAAKAEARRLRSQVVRPAPMSNEAFARVKIDALLAAQGWNTQDANRRALRGRAARPARAPTTCCATGTAARWP